MNNDKLIRLAGSDFILMEPFPEDKPIRKYCGYDFYEGGIIKTCSDMTVGGCPKHKGKKRKYRCEHGTCTNLTRVIRDGTPTCYKHGNADRIRLCRLRKLTVSGLA